MNPFQRLAREPVLIGAAIIATLEAAAPSLSTGWKIAAGAWVALLQRAFSSPKAAVEESKQAGYDAAVADVSSLQRVIPPPPLPG